MEHRVFHASDIHIDRKILIRLFTGDKLLFIMAVHIAQEVPGRAGPLRHGVCLPLGRCSADRAGGIYPLIDSGQRGFPRSCRLIAFYFRQC